MNDYLFRTEPYAHQRERFYLYRDKVAWAHLHEPRTGKSKLVIDTTAYNYEQGRIDAGFVIAPSGVHTNWIRNEVPVHCPERTNFAMFAYDTEKAATKTHQRRCQEALKHDGLLWVTMSYDGLTTVRGSAFAKKVLTTRRCMQVLDEAHRIKDYHAKRTDYAIASSKHNVMSRILTGTLVGNEPFDVYCPLLFLDPLFWAKNGFSTMTAFKAHFAEWVPRERFTGKFKQDRRTGEWERVTQRFNVVAQDPVTGEKRYLHLDKLGLILQQISDRVCAADVLDMPEDIFEKRYFTMTPEQQRLYDELRDDFITWLDSGDMITADLAIVRLMRLQQITCGYLPTEDGEEPYHFVPGENPRLKCLMDLLEDIPHQAIVWARFTPDVDMICAALDKAGESYVRYDGKVSKYDRAENVDTFQAGKVKWFIGKASAGGEGLPLFRAGSVIFYSSTYKLTERIQATDRAKLKGKKEHVGVVDIICPGSTDENIVMSLRQKRNIASIVNGDRIKEWI
jgi:SNF2 family DNA or RNA helicase